MDYEAVIGLEIHIQLRTEAKIFCGCPSRFGASPNSQVCPVCLGLPGALPVLNKKVIEYAILLALATGSRIRPRSVFARKNYFYPDLPKGYQISQFEEPLCEGGILFVDTAAGEKPVRIRRIHLEEDAGKSVHAESFVAADETLLDLNRCGTPLLELVTEPDLRTPTEAAALLASLRQLVRYLGICDGNMEEASLRCDANVSLRCSGSAALGVKTELKNMNTFRGVERALGAEIERQRDLLTKGLKVQSQTLLWNTTAQRVEPMRSKEASHDYRYFPEPDLPPLSVSTALIDSLRASLPELPAQRRARYQRDWQISPHDSAVLTEDREVAEYFEAVCAGVTDKRSASHWVMGEVLRAMRERSEPITQLPVTPRHLAALVNMVSDGSVNLTMAKRLFQTMLESGEDPRQAAEGLMPLKDEASLESIVAGVVSEYPQEAAAYRAGKEKLMGFFVGRVMAASGGRADARMTQSLLRRALTERS